MGGRGNWHFKSATNQTPRYAQPGIPGEEGGIGATGSRGVQGQAGARGVQGGVGATGARDVKHCQSNKSWYIIASYIASKD